MFKKAFSVVDVTGARRRSAWFGDTEVMAVETGGSIRVYSGMCPHQGGPLSEGEMTDTTLTCPWHGCTFELGGGDCVDIGSCKNVSGMKLRSLPFEIRGDEIWVSVGDSP